MITFAQQIFRDGPFNSVPSSLLLRENDLSHQVIPWVIISFVMITFAKFQNNSIFSSLFKLLFANKNFDQIVKEELKIGSSSSVILIVNYFFIISTCVFLSIQATLKIPFIDAIGFSLAIPVGVFILQLASLWLIGLITKEMKLIVTPLLETIIIIEFIGFILFFLALIWVLNPQFSTYFLKTFTFLLALGFIIRLLKGIFSVLRKGVSLYYIILYFCTLEILPLFIAYYYVTKNFLK